MFPTVLTNIKSVSYHSDNPEKYPWSGKTLHNKARENRSLVSHLQKFVLFLCWWEVVGKGYC